VLLAGSACGDALLSGADVDRIEPRLEPKPSDSGPSGEEKGAAERRCEQFLEAAGAGDQDALLYTSWYKLCTRCAQRETGTPGQYEICPTCERTLEEAQRTVDPELRAALLERANQCTASIDEAGTRLLR
jgi:hypothetical protein